MSSAYLPFFLKLAAAAKFCGPGSLNLIPYPCHVCSCSLHVQGSGAIHSEEMSGDEASCQNSRILDH
ncbi:hypothetical protein VTO58DRAFT_103773 [Aureobasidium pullulans]